LSELGPEDKKSIRAVIEGMILRNQAKKWAFGSYGG
jgi:hypothetical protein